MLWCGKNFDDEIYKWCAWVEGDFFFEVQFF